MAADAAFAEYLYHAPKGLQAIDQLFDSDLTPVRAGYLDRLQHLSSASSPTGDIALQAYLGTPSDAPALTTTVFAVLLQIHSRLQGVLR